MPYIDTVVIPIRLSKLTLLDVDEQAKKRRLPRSTWIREAVVKTLAEVAQKENVEWVERRLVARLDALQDEIKRHVTAEIDTLIQN